MKQITKRLLPGQDLREEIETLVREHSIKAGCLLSVVGNLRKVKLRMIGGKKVKTWDEAHEIVSGTGTVSVNGSHIHISVADIEGNVKGGHLKVGCIVHTTAEIVLLVFEDVEYKRKADSNTEYNELLVV